MSKKQQIAELENDLRWMTSALNNAEEVVIFLKGRVMELQIEKDFLNEHINALESVIDEKQETLDGMKALNDSLLEILDSLPD